MCNRDDENPPVDFGDHEPVGWRFGGIEQRVVGPHVEDIVYAEVWVFEQVGGLGVDFEGLVVVEVEEFGHLLRV